MLPDRLQQFFAPRRRLPGPQHLFQRPAGHGPSELLLRRQRPRLVNHRQRLVGEFRAEPKPSTAPGITSSLATLNYDSTTYWNKYVLTTAQSYQLHPVCWDTSGQMFNWTTGAVVDQNAIIPAIDHLSIKAGPSDLAAWRPGLRLSSLAANRGDEQQAADQYECHNWSKSQTGFDPTQPGGGVAQNDTGARRDQYQRAMTACLEARGYSVK